MGIYSMFKFVCVLSQFSIITCLLATVSGTTNYIFPQSNTIRKSVRKNKLSQTIDLTQTIVINV